ncbi:MAG: transcription antitermination factor NusB [Acidimicrobiia bacterium]
MDEDRRSEARERAVSLLYEAEIKEQEPGAVVAALPVAPDDLAVLLVEGVAGRQDEIDALLRRYTEGWTLERMPAVDRAILRVATFELVGRPEIPIAVVIDEAVELAKRLSTDDSGRFVNGMLSSIARSTRAS